jgi:hypothetical protein
VNKTRKGLNLRCICKNILTRLSILLLNRLMFFIFESHDLNFNRRKLNADNKSCELKPSRRGHDINVVMMNFILTVSQRSTRFYAIACAHLATSKICLGNVICEVV